MGFEVDRQLAAEGIQQGVVLACEWFRQHFADFDYNASGFASVEDLVRAQIFATREIVDPIDLFRLFCTNSQNRSGARDMVPTRNWNTLGEAVLFDYDFTSIAESYPCGEHVSDELCDVVLAKHRELGPGNLLYGDVDTHVRGLERRSAESAWCKLLHTVQAAATRFAELAGEADDGDARRAILGDIIAVPAHAVNTDMVMETIARFAGLPNVGVGLVANFLKDSGLPHFVKPDRQLCRVVGRAFGRKGEDLPDDAISEWFIVYASINYAQAAECAPAALDRLMWLAGSGTFYVVHPSLVMPRAGRDERIDTLAEALRPAIVRYAL